MTQQAQVNPGWEERYQAVRDRVHIELPSYDILQGLHITGVITSDEMMRSSWKIRLLEPFVTRMVVNMIKGSIKYTTDDWSEATWQDMGMDDKADSINYELLFQDWMRKQGYIT